MLRIALFSLDASTPRSFGLRVIPILTVLSGLTACATGPRVVQDSPPASQKVAGAEVRFDWHVEDTAEEEFTGYEIQVSGDPEFKSMEVNRVVPAPPVTIKLPAKRWFWRVRGRYRTVGDRVRETQWSDVHYVGGRYVRRTVSFENTGAGEGEVGLPDAPAAPDAGSSGDARAKVAGKGGKKQRRASGKRARRAGGPKVVAAHDDRPVLTDIRSISVAPVRTDGEPHQGLTREVVLRLYQTKRIVLLEGSFFREDQVVSIPPEVVETLAAAGGKIRPATLGRGIVRENRFVLDPSQPTAMLPPNAVRLARPDAVLVVRLYNIDVDPASLPKPPGKAKDRAGMIRFEDGIRVLNATLVVMATGEISWTASLYSRIGVSDLTLVEDMVRRYFR